MKINKRKAILGSFSAVAAAAIPVATAVSCGPSVTAEHTLKNGNFTLGVPTVAKADPKNIDAMNANTAPILEKAFKTNLTSKQINGAKVHFEISPDNNVVAQSVYSGKVEGGFVPSEIMAKYKNKLKIAFLAARKSMYYRDSNGNQVTDTNAKAGKEFLNKLKDKINKELKGLEEDKKDPTIKTPSKFTKANLYSDAKNDFYRAAIYFNKKSAKDAWDKGAKATTQADRKAALEEFMHTGIITHSASSNSGYIVPQRMIAKHFKVPNFKLTDYGKDVTPGSMLDLETNPKKSVYFSFAGEVLQSPNPLTKFSTDLQVLELSEAIPNDGFVVRKGLDKKLIEGLLKSFQEVTKQPNNMIKKIYYHETYKAPTKQTLDLIYALA